MKVGVFHGKLREYGKRVGVRTLAGLLALLFTIIPTPAYAWGSFGHELILALAAAIGQKDNPLGQLFQENVSLLKLLGIAPDFYWKEGGRPLNPPEVEEQRKKNDKTEHEPHFFGIDAYLHDGKPTPEALAELPTESDFQVAMKKLQERIGRNLPYVNRINTKPLENAANPTPGDINNVGTSPWRVVQLYNLGVAALKAGKFDLAAYYLGTMGHYIGDAFQPFHGSLRYNPGHIHSPYEEQIEEADARHDGETLNYQTHEWKVEQTLKKLLQRLGLTKPEKKAYDGDNLIPRLYEALGSGLNYIDPLIKVFEAAKASHPLQANQNSFKRSNHHGPPHSDVSPEALAAFAQSKVQIPGHGEQTVLDSAYDRIIEAGLAVSAAWNAAYAEALKDNPELATQLANAKLAPFDEASVVNKYPPPNYLKFSGPPGSDAQCRRWLSEL